MSFDLWRQMMRDRHVMVLRDYEIETMYHMAVAAWGRDEQMVLNPSSPNEIDLTKLYEQYRMLKILKQKEPDHAQRINSEDC
jgi:hypothetical protein